MGVDSEQDMINNYLKLQETRKARPRSRYVMDFGQGTEDVAPYMAMKHPGTQLLKMISDPYCVLKNGESKRKAWKYPGASEYCWRKAHDRYTKTGIFQGWLTPVFKDEIDMTSPHAIFDTTDFPTKDKGFQAQVTVDGLCLYRLSEKKAYEWFASSIDMHKGELARMRFNAGDSFRQAGFDSPDNNDENGFMKITNTRSESAIG
jgi:hypothetical protein